MSSSFMPADIAGLLQATEAATPKNSTSRKNSNDLSMEDFLQLMIVQLQNQTIDDAMDTSEMMNQMVQMQMISAISNMTDASLMSYASSLVGKVVTIGINHGNALEEREIQVIGTGMMNGQQVIFGSDGQAYGLNQIMAVGRLPDVQEPGTDEKPDDKDPVEDPDKTEGTEGADKPGDGDSTGTDAVDTPKEPEDTSKLPDDRPVDNVGEGQDVPDSGSGDSVEPTEPATGAE